MENVFMSSDQKKGLRHHKELKHVDDETKMGKSIENRDKLRSEIRTIMIIEMVLWCLILLCITGFTTYITMPDFKI